MQHQLIQSEKLAVIGSLADGMAHEINNPIGFINSNLDMMKRYNEKFTALMKEADALLTGSEAKEAQTPAGLSQAFAALKQKYKAEYMLSDSLSAIQESKEGVQRVRRIVDALNEYTKDDTGDVHPVAVQRVIEEVLVLLTSQFKSRINLTKEFTDIPDILCHVNEFRSLLVHLLRNAGQAIQEQGDIAIKVFQEGQYAVISIRDTGIGIAQEHLDRIYDPFFTTKDPDIAMGLGLSIVQSIVERFDSYIEITSQEGAGTEVKVGFPLTERAEQKKESNHAA